MESVNAGRAVVDVLKAEGVRHVFGLPGGHVLDIYDALYDTPEIRHVLVRHEQVAASMAAGYAQLTGEPGVCLVTAGPGVTNLLSGIAEAYVGSLPIVVLGGRGSTATAHKGASQEVSTERVFGPVTKWAVRVDRADLLVDLLRQAFVVARNGKPGPVLLDIPKDLLGQDVPVLPYTPAGPPMRSSADPERVSAAAAAFAAAKRPIIIAGGGTVASGAFAELRELAELTAAPVLTSLAGRGSISDDHPLSVGGLGAHRNRLSSRLLGEADFVLGLGTRFEEMETNWRPGFVPSPDACYVQVDTDAAEIGRSVPARIGVVADIRLFVDQLIAEFGRQELFTRSVDWRELSQVRAFGEEIDRIDRDVEPLVTDEGTPLSPMRVFSAIREAFPKETTVAIDVGVITQHMAGAFPFFRVYEPRSLIVPSSYYGMGFSAAALPAARLAHPDRQAVGFVGDGSFQMVMNVLPAAAEERLPVTWCVFNDNALGSIRDIQEFAKDNRYIATDFAVQPDFAAIARASACHGERVESPSEIKGAIVRAQDANARGVPAVLDFSVARQRLQQSRDHFDFYPRELDSTV